jgi:putative aldouronate transport system substrate-binding protein
MNEEIIAMPADRAREMISAGQFFYVEHGWYLSGTANTLYANDPNALYDYCGFLVGDGGETPYVGADGSGAWTSMITANAKDPARVIQFFSYMTQPENQINQMFGWGSWEMGEDSKIHRTEEANTLRLSDSAAYSAKYGTFLEFFNDNTVSQKYSPARTPETDANYEVNVRMTDNRFAEFGDRYYSNGPFVNINPEAGSDIAILRATIDSYWNERQVQMITAASAEECEVLYDQTLQEVFDMGFQDVIDYYNVRFQANKAKLGVELYLPYYTAG